MSDRHTSSFSPPVNGTDNLTFENAIEDQDAHPSSSPQPSATGQLPTSLSPVRWSRRRFSNQYLALDSSPNLSTANGKNEYAVAQTPMFPEDKGFHTDKESFALEISPSSTGELPKLAIRRGLRGNWSKVLPHLAAICVTVAVVQLSFRDVYWMDLVPPEQQILPGLTQAGALNFLQLAAKLHELLILASLSSLVLHAVQAHLMGGSGLPLGLVSNAFELGSGEYLRRKSFWSAWWSVDQATGRRFPYMRFWLLSLLCTLLVTLAGPSSAISVIPTLNYFDLPRPFVEPVLPYYVFNKSTELWPERLNTGSLTAPNSGIACLNPDSYDEQQFCPAGGFRDTYAWAQSLLFTDSDRGTNISFADSTGDTRRVLTAQSCNSTFDGRASAVSLTGFVSGAMTAYWTYVERNLQGMALKASHPRINIDAATSVFAPRVEVMCNSYPNYGYNPKRPDDQPSMTFPVMHGANPIQVPDWTYKYSRPVNATNFTFVELPKTEALSPSIGAVLTLPLIEDHNGTWEQNSENIACSLYSQWVPVDVWYEPRNSDQLSYTVETSLADSCLVVPSDASSDRQPINTTILAGYANAINQPLPFITGGNQPAFLATLETFLYHDSTYVPNGVFFQSPIPGVAGIQVTDEMARKLRAKLVSTLLAGFVTDGMARIAGNGVFPYAAPVFLLSNRSADGDLQGLFPVSSATGGEVDPLNTTNIAEEARWLRLDPVLQRYGYGYRIRGSRTTQFGISVLLIHLVVSVAHLSFVLNEISGRGHGIQRGAETIPEMLALALNSRASQMLRNTCAGISQTTTWREVVAVRETSEMHLEMLVGVDEVRNASLAKPGVRYGALPDASSENEQIRRRPRRRRNSL